LFIYTQSPSLQSPQLYQQDFTKKIFTSWMYVCIIVRVVSELTVPRKTRAEFSHPLSGDLEFERQKKKTQEPCLTQNDKQPQH
jgi:hypothetical protein